MIQLKRSYIGCLKPCDHIQPIRWKLLFFERRCKFDPSKVPISRIKGDKGRKGTRQDKLRGAHILNRNTLLRNVTDKSPIYKYRVKAKYWKETEQFNKKKNLFVGRLSSIKAVVVFVVVVVDVRHLYSDEWIDIEMSLHSEKQVR